MEMNSVVKLGLDVYRGTVQTEFTNGQDAEMKLREALIEANGGSDKINLKALRKNGGEIFSIIEEVISIVVEDGLKGDEFFMNFVDYKNLAEGDRNEFVVEANSEFIVADMANGIATPRRQRIGEDTKISVPTVTKGVRVYEELSRVLSGRTSWSDFIDKVVKAVMQRRYMDVYTAFSGLSGTTPGMDPAYVTGGTYSEAALLDLVEHIEAATGKTAMIIGTKAALRKITTAVVAHEAETSYYNVGHYGKVAGVEMMSIKNVHKAGTNTFMLPDNKVWIVAGGDQFIKFVTEGDAIIIDKPATDNADLSQEYTYIENNGCALILSQKMGVYSL